MKDVNKRSRIAELINDHAADVPKRKAASKRMSSEERFEQIVDVAVKIIGQKGYYGMSLQDVANEIGISQTAVIHRVKSKQGLLIAVIERHYDKVDAVERYLAQFRDGGPRAGERPRIPEVLRAVVRQNAAQPEMVKVFEMLNTEAMSPVHPAYAYLPNVRLAWLASSASRTGWCPREWTVNSSTCWRMPQCMAWRAVGWPGRTRLISWLSGNGIRTIFFLCRSGMAAAKR